MAVNEDRLTDDEEPEPEPTQEPMPRSYKMRTGGVKRKGWRRTGVAPSRRKGR